MLQPLLLLLWILFTGTAMCWIQETHFGGRWGSKNPCWKDQGHLVTTVHLHESDIRNLINLFTLSKLWRMWRERWKRLWKTFWSLLRHLYYLLIPQKRLTWSRSRFPVRTVHNVAFLTRGRNMSSAMVIASSRKLLWFDGYTVQCASSPNWWYFRSWLSDYEWFGWFRQVWENCEETVISWSYISLHFPVRAVVRGTGEGG